MLCCGSALVLAARARGTQLRACGGLKFHLYMKPFCVGQNECLVVVLTVVVAACLAVLSVAVSSSSYFSNMYTVCSVLFCFPRSRDKVNAYSCSRLPGAYCSRSCLASGAQRFLLLE